MQKMLERNVNINGLQVCTLTVNHTKLLHEKVAFI